MPSSGDRVYVLIVNFRRWQDTIECLESVLRSRGADFRVVVCDNGSADGSWERLQAWAAGTADSVPASGSMARLSQPPLPKPVDHVAIGEAEAGGTSPSGHVTFIRSATNRGFAGGNNLCLRHALNDPAVGWFWLLNNDVVVEPDAMAHLVRHMASDRRIGMCGSTVAFYDRPETVQALGGGSYLPWLGTVRHVGEGTPVDEARMASPDYVLGASLMVSAAFVRRIGFLSEDYFLYFEELDWAARAGGQFTVAHAPDSMVYHKEGGTSGSTRAGAATRPAFADYCGIRSRLLFTRRFHPWALPTVCLGLLGVIVNRAVRRQWRRIAGMLRLLLTLGGPRHALPAWMGTSR